MTNRRRDIKAKFYPEGIDRPRWMLFCDKDGRRHWRYFLGTGDLYEQLCQWNARLWYAGYNREDHRDKFDAVHELYAVACAKQASLEIPFPGVLKEYNTAMNPLDLTKRKWQDKVGRILWRLRLI